MIISDIIFTDQARIIISQDRCTIDGSVVKVKTEDKYLGDFLHTGGLAKSVEVTVNKRYGVCLNEVLELKAVLEDFRMQSLGGIKVGMEIFNLAILPKLIYNSETWIEMNEKAFKILENLQNIFMRCVHEHQSSAGTGLPGPPGPTQG